MAFVWPNLLVYSVFMGGCLGRIFFPKDINFALIVQSYLYGLIIWNPKDKNISYTHISLFTVMMP